MRIYFAPRWFVVVRWTIIVVSLGRGRVYIVYPFGEGTTHNKEES